MTAAAEILLVDDDPKVLRLLEATLRLKDYQVIKMESAAEALRYLVDSRPSLIISDIMMPDLDGYDFLRRLRAGAASDVPFIFLSARSEPADVVKGLQLGADEFLRKPFSIDELLVRVERVLDRSSPSAVDTPRGAFEGDLEHMSVPDLLRMLCVQRKTGALQVDLLEGRHQALLSLDQGHVVHATLGQMEGEVALFQLLLHDRGRFSFRPDQTLPGKTIDVQTLPLLMEGYRLLDSGILRRVDPNSRVATAALALVVEGARSASPPLPAIEDVLPEVSDVRPLRMPRGKPPPGTATVDLSQESLDEADFSETMALQGDSILHDLDLPSLSSGDLDEVGKDSVVAHLGRSADMDDDDWERSGLLSFDGGLEPARADGDEPQEGAQPSDDDEELDLDDFDALDSVQFAAGFLTSEIAALEEELGSNPARGRIIITQEIATIDPEPEAMPEPQLEPIPQSTAVSLVEDTAIEVPQLVDFDAAERSAALMDLFKHLKVETSSKLKTRQTQLQTRAGQVIASDIQDPVRRTSLAAFASQAIGFASRDESSGMQFAVLDAGDLHVLVLEVDQGRLYSILFELRPEPADVIKALKPVLDQWRIG
jgi:DNA-binding response OmpR family regulator